MQQTSFNLNPSLIRSQQLGLVGGGGGNLSNTNLGIKARCNEAICRQLPLPNLGFESDIQLGRFLHTSQQNRFRQVWDAWWLKMPWKLEERDKSYLMHKQEIWLLLLFNLPKLPEQSFAISNCLFIGASTIVLCLPLSKCISMATLLPYNKVSSFYCPNKSSRALEKRNRRRRPAW